MIFYSITNHEESCERAWLQNFVFQYEYEFYYISYCYCQKGYVHLDWKLTLLNSISKKTGNIERYDTYSRNNVITKSNVLSNITSQKMLNYLLEKNNDEVCYVYADNANKDYAMVNRMSFTEYLTYLLSYENNIRNAIKQVRMKDVFSREDKEDIISTIIGLARYNKNYFEELSDFKKITFTQLLSNNYLKNKSNDNYNSKQFSRNEASIK